MVSSVDQPMATQLEALYSAFDSISERDVPAAPGWVLAKLKRNPFHWLFRLDADQQDQVLRALEQKINVFDFFAVGLAKRYVAEPWAEFHNNLRILHGIDRHEVAWMDDAQWAAFRDNPVRFFLKCDDEQIDMIWSVIVARQPRWAAE